MHLLVAMILNLKLKYSTEQMELLWEKNVLPFFKFQFIHADFLECFAYASLPHLNIIAKGTGKHNKHTLTFPSKNAK